jgi:hypothetical protein
MVAAETRNFGDERGMEVRRLMEGTEDGDEEAE